MNNLKRFITLTICMCLGLAFLSISCMPSDTSQGMDYLDSERPEVKKDPNINMKENDTDSLPKSTVASTDVRGSSADPSKKEGECEEAGRTCDGADAIGLSNPAAVYCKEMGYEYKAIESEEGETGIVVLPNGKECDAWDFYNGECGKEFSYCAKKGWDVASKAKQDSFAETCTTCVLPDGSNKAVSELLELENKCTVGLRIADEKKGLDKTDAVDPGVQQGNLGLPTHFDWRNKDDGNWMTPVKDQGSCGSCWAFATAGIVEPQYNIYYGDPDIDLDLSEQYLVSDCCTFCGDCNGGSHKGALEFVRDQGTTDEDCFPYTASNAPCYGRCSDWSDRLYRIDETGGVASNIDTIRQYVVDNGPLAVAMGISVSFGGYWDNGIYRCTNDSGANHAVVIVGYDETDNYWIVRNSWGSSWNDDGHFKVGCGECSIENYVYYAVLADVCDIHLESAEDNAATSNKGTITIDSIEYSLANNAAIAPGSYTAIYNPESGYEFQEWEVSGSLSVSDLNAQTTTVTVDCGGTLRAIFTDDGGPVLENQPVYVDMAATGAGDGTSWANAFNTIQAAWDSLPTIIDHDITIKVSEGATPYREQVEVKDKYVIASVTIEGEYYWQGDCQANGVSGNIVDTTADFSNVAVGDKVLLMHIPTGAVGAVTDYEVCTVDDTSNVGLGIVGTDGAKTATTNWDYVIVKTEISGSDDRTDGGTARDNAFYTASVDNITIRGFYVTFTDDDCVTFVNSRKCYVNNLICENVDDCISALSMADLTARYVYVESDSYGIAAYTNSYVDCRYAVMDSNAITSLAAVLAGRMSGMLYGNAYIADGPYGVSSEDESWVYGYNVIIDGSVSVGLQANLNSSIRKVRITNNAVTAESTSGGGVIQS